MSRSRFQSTDTPITLASSLSSESLFSDIDEEESQFSSPLEVQNPEELEESNLIGDVAQESPSSSISSISNTNNQDNEDLKRNSTHSNEPADKKLVEGDGQKEKEEDEEYFNRWVRFMNYVRHILTEAVTKISTIAAKNPKTTVWGITFLSFALAGIGFATNFNMDVAAQKMYTPKTSRIREHQNWVEQVSGFPAMERSLRMIVHKDNGKGNVLNRETVEGVFEAIDTVRDTPGYEEVCADSDFEDENGDTTCRIRGVTLFWNNSLEVFRKQVPSDTDVILQVSKKEYPDQSPVDVLEIMGLTEEHRGFAIVDARAFFLEIALPSTTSEEFEMKVVDNLLNLKRSWRSSKLGLEFLSSTSLENETTRSVLRDIPLVPVVFLVMSCFTCLVFARRDKVRSRSVLGLGAVVCVFLSVVSGYGLMFFCGVNFTSLTQILPFVIFGIGLDDAFIIIGAYNRTDPNKDVIDRIQETTRDIGLSIVLTTVTTTMAFGLGCLSNLPALYWLSFYAFSTMIIVFFYSITFFVALIVLDERRIQENRRDCCICITATKNMDDETAEKSMEEAAEEGVSPTKHSKKASEFKAGNETNNTTVIRFMDWYGNFLMKPVVKGVVIIAFLSFAMFCAYSTSLFKQEFNVTEMLPGDSYAKDYLAASDKYGQRGWVIPAAYFRNVDQSDPDVQKQMEDYVDEMVTIESISSPPPLFWLRHFKKFLTYDDRLLDLTFNQQLDIFLSHSPFKELFGPNIVRDQETGDIIASRCVLYMDKININSVDSQLQALYDQREVTSAQAVNFGVKDYNFFLWSPQMFTWDFYANTVDELSITTVLGVFSVCFIGFAFIPHWSAVCFLFPLISVLYIDLVGFLQLTGNHLNVVSYFSLVLSIGLQVDFLMHILLRYHECPGGTREEKVKAALKSMGASVLVGGLSTMLGVLPLAFSTSQLMRTVFVAFIGMVGLGVTHGLVVLPVVLSIVGPTATMKEYKPTPKEMKQKQLQPESSSIEQGLP